MNPALSGPVGDRRGGSRDLGDPKPKHQLSPDGEKQRLRVRRGDDSIPVHKPVMSDFLANQDTTATDGGCQCRPPAGVYQTTSAGRCAFERPKLRLFIPECRRSRWFEHRLTRKQRRPGPLQSPIHRGCTRSNQLRQPKNKSPAQPPQSGSGATWEFFLGGRACRVEAVALRRPPLARGRDRDAFRGTRWTPEALAGPPGPVY